VGLEHVEEYVMSYCHSGCWISFKFKVKRRQNFWKNNNKYLLIRIWKKVQFRHSSEMPLKAYLIPVTRLRLEVSTLVYKSGALPLHPNVRTGLLISAILSLKNTDEKLVLNCNDVLQIFCIPQTKGQCCEGQNRLWSLLRYIQNECVYSS
jgi:hypothetical protein